MLFNSFEFLIFFVVVFGLYKGFNRSVLLQNSLLLVASYLFYGWWDARFLYLIVFSTVTDYCSALMIQNGKLSLKQRLVPTIFLLLSGFLFIVLDWTNLTNLILFSDKSGDDLLHWTSFEKNVMLWSTILMFAGNIFYYLIVKFPEQTKRKLYLVLSVVVNLTLLGVFKYFNFFIDSFADMFGGNFNTWTLNIILPVGISFYTFQTMSYTIDVYRKELKASSDILEFATYVAFFPQLVAGPIERGKHLLPQFRKARPALSTSDTYYSLWLIVWGLFKKLVVADNMAVIVNSVFGNYDEGAMGLPSGSSVVIVGVLAFAFQIYGDFSGYTDIARGVAKLMGFDIMLNFNLPYFAVSPSDFWRRWHISLSSWLRDYLYIPLGGNKKGTFGTYKNLSLTMLLGGLWHGAAWTFVLWGAYHGLILVIYRILKIDFKIKNRKRWQTFFLITIMFILTLIGWLIFRAQNMTTIWIFLKSIFVVPFNYAAGAEYIKQFFFYGWFIFGYQFLQYFTKDLYPIKNMHWFLRFNFWLFVIISLFVLSSQVKQEFIYFAF